jgi:threonine dehydratase
VSLSMTHGELGDIAAAIRPYIHRTPLWYSRTLSERAGCRVHLKAELFQKTGSYKPRGMLWALMSLTSEAKSRGVITFSAGNAAQGLAYAAKLLKIKATVVMPAAASQAKAAATREYGAEVIMFGSPQECLAHCRTLAAERGLTFISSYDDITLMKGHATLGLEVLDDLPSTRAMYVGIGGGGMAGGLALAADALGNAVELHGVEPKGAAAMCQSLEAGHPISLTSASSVADGLAAPSSGELCFPLVRDRFTRVQAVSDDKIMNAMALLMERCKLFAEPAGAASLAGLLEDQGSFAETDDVVCVVSGGNIDLQRLIALTAPQHTDRRELA